MRTPASRRDKDVGFLDALESALQKTKGSGQDGEPSSAPRPAGHAVAPQGLLPGLTGSEDTGRFRAVATTRAIAAYQEIARAPGLSRDLKDR